MESINYSPAIASFRSLHESGCFLLPNPWDIGSAKALANLGFKALATTSAGFAFTCGLQDDASALSIVDVLAHIKDIVAATDLPINADFQSGYAHEPEGVARNVTLCVDTGVAGLSIEDSTGDRSKPLYEGGLALERVRAARIAIDETNTGVVLTARCEAWLVGDRDPERTAINRLVSFAEAGADCLFAPGVRDSETISNIVRAVAPKPVNVIMSAPVPGLSFPRLEELGVRRISLGSALARVAWDAWMRAAKNISRSGNFDSLSEAASFEVLNDLFRG